MYNIAPSLAKFYGLKAVWWLGTIVAFVSFTLFALLFRSPRPEERQEDERHGKERQGKKALRTWREKLDYLLEQEAVLSNPAQKFELTKQIEEARRKIRELGERAN